MKVKELIKLLQEVDQESSISIESLDDWLNDRKLPTHDIFIKQIGDKVMLRFGWIEKQRPSHNEG